MEKRREESLYKKIVLIGEDILVDELGDQQGLNHENVGQIRCNLHP